MGAREAALALSVLLLVSCTAAQKNTTAVRYGAPQGKLVVMPSQYPEVYRDDTVDDMHGVEVADPYRWLEETDSPEVENFIEEQNNLTDSVIKPLKDREPFKKLYSQFLNVPRYSAPSKHGDRYFWSFNTGLQNQDVYFSQLGLDGPNVTLFDPNTLSKDGTVAVGDSEITKDGTMIAYQVASGGSDWQTIYVASIDPKTGIMTKLQDEMVDVKFSGTSWTADNKGFFYSRFPKPNSTDLGTENSANLNQQIWYHVVGTPQSQDTFVYATPENPRNSIGATTTDDGRYLIITTQQGTDPNNTLALVDLEDIPINTKMGALDFSGFTFGGGKKLLPLTKLVNNTEASWNIVTNNGTLFWLSTNLDAPNYRLVRGDLSEGSPATWEDLLPESTDMLESTLAVKGDKMLVEYLHNVVSQLQLRDLNTGELIRTLPTGLGTIGGLSGNIDQTEVFYSYSSFTEPGSTYRYDTATPDKDPALWRKTNVAGWNPANYTTVQEWTTSKDGTRMPVFITYPKDIVLDGTNPTILYAYGGFAISTTPTFSTSRAAFMQGFRGVYATATIRGGGEFGTTWHMAGQMHNKQNGFDDFIAAAEHLIKQNYTSPAKLVINGASNGGTLMGVAANQRPDLFGAVLVDVGVHDMFRFFNFTIGHAWMTEYGDPTNAADFAIMKQWSPLHNVRVPNAGTKEYPAMLLSTGDHDDRVAPLHSFKMAATLQHTLAGYPDSPQRNPLLLRVETRAGHGAGKPTSAVLESKSAEYAFAMAAIGARWVYKAEPALRQ